MKTIIAATDFSPVSRNAARYAADLAVAIDAELLLVNTVELPATLSEAPVSGYAFDRMIEGTEEELVNLKIRLARHVGNKITIETKSSVGSVPYMLKEECRQRQVLCIVMGPDNATFLEHVFAENHALAAIHSVSVPVLIVPEQTSFEHIHHVVLASDLSEPFHVSSLHYLKEWLELFVPKLDVVNVIGKSQPEPEALAGSIGFENQLAKFNPQLHFINEDRVSEGIQRYVRLHHPDLLVTIPGKYDFFSGLFHKSQSKQLIRHPHLPVLCIPG